MAWDENVDVIVMLTRVKEKGRVCSILSLSFIIIELFNFFLILFIQLKCYEYWPVDSEEYETFTVTLDKQNDDDAVIIRNFTVKNNKVIFNNYVYWIVLFGNEKLITISLKDKRNKENYSFPIY